MSGGRLVVLDRLGRDVKFFPLQEGLATIGSDPVCDIRVMLSNVSPHHATVIVHAHQTVVQSVSAGATLVNGAAVSVAALRHGDEISLGGRRLRWEYSDPKRSRPLAPLPSLVRRSPRAARARRASGAAPLRLAPPHRASVPAGTGGKQVAIVQPQRRDTSEHHESTRAAGARARGARQEDSDAADDQDASKRWANGSIVDSESTTKATMWIESRKKTPTQPPRSPGPAPAGHTPASPARNPARNSGRNLQTPARTPRNSGRKSSKRESGQSSGRTSTRKSARSPVFSPAGDTSRARSSAGDTGRGRTPAGHTARSEHSPPENTPRVGRTSPGNTSVPGRSPPGNMSRAGRSPLGNTSRAGRSPAGNTSRAGRKSRKSGRTPHKIEAPLMIDQTKQTAINRMSGPRLLLARPAPRARPATVSSLDSSSQQSSQTDISMYDESSSVLSPAFGNPKKSALKNPASRQSSRKTETIKFDLSNIENSANRSSDVVFLSESKNQSSVTDLSLHYSDNSILTPSPRRSIPTPSPRRSIHSRSSRMLEKTGTSITQSFASEQSTLTPEAPKRKSSRGTLILKKALENSRTASRQSRRTTAGTDQSYGSTLTSIKKTRSPRESNQNLESYSIVDLVSIDSDKSGRSIYNSVGSTPNLTFDTPQTQIRKTRSANISLLGSSTPYDKSRKISPKQSQEKSRTRRSTSELITPENAQKPSLNSTKISKASKSRSRINESDVFLVDDEEDASPRSSRRGKSSGTSPRKNISLTASSVSPQHVAASVTISPQGGNSTPENKNSPEDAGTPVLSIQSLLDESALSRSSLGSIARSKPSRKRKTIGAVRVAKKPKISAKSKSLIVSRQRSSKKKSTSGSEEKIVTPRSSITLLQEAVKNKHSTAKQPSSKRSIIDNLNESDIVKQLFSSPVKRKLSQSMIEFSKNQLLDDGDVVSIRPTRKTIALTANTPDVSLIDRSDAFTPEVFVSPLNSPSNSPNLTGIKRLYRKNTPENDLSNVKGVKKLLRTPRVRKSIKNDLTNVAGVKKVFAKSPKNRLSDVRVKEIFAALPKNDLTRVSGVRKLYETRKRGSPKLMSPDVTGVRSLFKRNPRNDLRNVSGVKETLKSRSPKNDLRNVKDIKHMFRENKATGLSDVSGIEELFEEPQNLDSTFDQLIGKPPVKSYVKSKSLVISKQKKSKRQAKSLHDSIDFITNNVEDWLEKELNKRTKHKGTPKKSPKSSNVSRELQKLATDTVEGIAPLLSSKVRSSTNQTLNKTQSFATLKKSASEIYSARKLPIKKRSLVEASVNKSDNRSLITLPIKKRVVVHSTPVKSKVNMTMNTTELGRVSPIAAVEKLDIDTVEVPTLPLKESPKPKRGRGKKTIEVEVPNIQIQIISPKKTRAKAKPVTPVQKKAKPITPVQKQTRARRTTAAKVSAKNKRASLTITKKPPVLSPKPVAKAQTQDVPAVEPKPMRSTRQKVNVPTPKKTRSKLQKTPVIVSPKSIKQVEPRQIRKTRGNIENENPIHDKSPKLSRATRKNEMKHAEEKPKAQKKSPEVKPEPQKKTAVGNAKPQKKSVEEKPKRGARLAEAKPKRGSKITEEKSKVEKKSKEIIEAKEVSIEPRKGRRTKTVENISPVPSKRGRKTLIEPVENITRKTRGVQNASVTQVTESQRNRSRKTKSQTESEIKPKKQNSIEIKSTKTTRTQTQAKIEEDKPQIKGKGKVKSAKNQSTKTESETDTESPVNRRTRRRQVTFVEESKVIPVGRKGRHQVEKSESSKPVSKKNQKTMSVAETKAKKAPAVVEVKTTRGKKVAPPEDSVPEGKGRKRKTIAEEPAKGAAEAGTKRRRLADTPPPRARTAGGRRR